MKKSSTSNSVRFIAFYANLWIIVVLNPNMEFIESFAFFFSKQNQQIRKSENQKIKNDSEINVLPALAL